MKRLLDIVASVAGLVVGGLVLIPAMIAVWSQDGHSGLSGFRARPGWRSLRAR